MIPISISVKSLIEKLHVFSYKRINSDNIKTEIKNDRIAIHQQFNNSPIHQVNLYVHEKEDIKEKTIDNGLTGGGAAFKIDDFPDVWNKVF
jgi:hypothetical protein